MAYECIPPKNILVLCLCGMCLSWLGRCRLRWQAAAGCARAAGCSRPAGPRPRLGREGGGRGMWEGVAAVWWREGMRGTSNPHVTSRSLHTQRNSVNKLHNKSLPSCNLRWTSSAGPNTGAFIKTLVLGSIKKA